MWGALTLLGLLGLPGEASVTAEGAASASADKAAPTMPRPDAPLARPGLPTAHVVGPRAAEAYYRFHGASLGGRSVRAHQGGVLLGVVDHFQLGFDYVDILAKGRTPGNYLEASGWGVSVKHNIRPWDRRPDTALSLELERRAASARARVGDGEAIPPSATVYSVNVDFTTKLAEPLTVHGRAGGSYLSLGPELAGWALGGGGGADYRFLKWFALEANASVYQNVGSVRGTDVAVSGGVACGRRFGPFAAVTGTLWPTGVPMTGGPLADAAVFRMDPVVETQPVGKTLTNAALAVLSLQAGFRAEW